MNTSDYAMGLVLQQRHADLLREARDNALAREAAAPRDTVVLWWRRLTDRPKWTPAGRVGRRTPRLQPTH